MRAARRAVTFILVALLAAAAIYFLMPPGGREGISLTFLGGAMEVGGSCILVEDGETSFLVDCGAFGSSEDGILPDDPSSVSFMILTHAHTDHCGKIPELFAAGFDGPVYCTPETADLSAIMLGMSRNFDRDRVSEADFDRALAAFHPVAFGEKTVDGEVTFVLRRAQHLLGAAFAEVTVDTGLRKTRVTFSGDIGSGGAILLPPADSPSGTDYLVMESTYGGTVREKGDAAAHARYSRFGREVGTALAAGGDVLIPAFTLGRTQEVIAALDIFVDEGVIPQGTEFYIDSPTARKVSDVYRAHAGELSATARALYGEDVLRRPYHREVRSRTSMKVHGRRHRPTVFISSSGDLDYANSPRHLVRMAAGADNLLCIVGWQSYGSVGRQLADGDSTVFVRYREDGETKKVWISPALRVSRFSAFSSHADQDGLAAWSGSIEGLRSAFLVHGEPDQAASLAARLEEELGIEIRIPEAGEKVFLSSR